MNAQLLQRPNYFRHQTWSSDDGLPQQSVHAILQSHEGYLWIATEEGAARFDGQSFRVLDHSTVPAFISNDVSCLAEDQAGDIWFGTSDGLVRKHGEEYRRFSTHDGLPSDGIVALTTSPSGPVVLTTEGLATWRVDRFERFATDEVITGLTGSERGPVLISKKSGVYDWNNGKPVLLATAGQDQPAALGAVIGDTQAIWTFGSNFVHLSSPSQTKTWRVGVDLPGNRVQTLYVDRLGTAWIGTNRGLVSLGAPGFLVHRLEAFNGESILSICVDRENDLWVGTDASGLHELQPRKFATVPGSSSEAVTTIARSGRGVMYFGTRDDGIFRAESGAERVAPNKLTSSVILSLAGGQGADLWAGTPDGISHIVGNEVKRWTIADGLPDNFARSVVVATDGTVWAGTRFGLVHIDGDTVRTYTSKDGLVSESIGPLLQTGIKQNGENVLWVGTSAGLCRKGIDRFNCLSSPYPPNGTIITALASDRDGEVWVAVHGHGLGVAHGDRIAPIPAPALPAEIVGILADDTGYLWLRSPRGLYRVPINGVRACTTNPSVCNNLTVESYGRSDGMQSVELADVGIPSLAQGPNGELWFATRLGISVTDPNHLKTNRIPPNVIITQVHADATELPVGVSAEIKPGHRQYTFEYIGVSLNNPGGVRCRYMLDGFDHGWIAAGTRSFAYYTNLLPRQYRFRVACANSDGLWSTDEATFRFRVLVPWYRSVWIYLLAGFTVALLIISFVQLRVRTERRHFTLVLQERTRVAREVHDTLAQDLVSVSLQVEMAAQHAKAGRMAEVSDQLTQTRSLVRQALESARQSIWNLRASLTEDSLPVRLASRVEAFRKTKMPARLRVSGEYRSAAKSVENEVMRIAAEAISNVGRHSGATEMVVELSYSANSLRLQVQDNGRGFNYTSARRMADHYGLRGLEERATLLGADLSVESIVGQGTIVRLLVPLPMGKSS